MGGNIIIKQTYKNTKRVNIMNFKEMRLINFNQVSFKINATHKMHLTKIE